MLIFQIKRIISSEKWFNYVVTFFFLEMPKIWVGQTTLNGEEREDGLSCRLPQILRPSLQAFVFFLNESATYSYIDHSRHHKSNWKTKVGGLGKEEGWGEKG